MKENRLMTPVVIIIFNRPDTTKRVFDAIREAKPLKLFVIADGPREDHPQDPEKCTASRAIIEQVDWDCEVATNYVEKNLGCKKRVSSGIDWVFDQVEQAIFLEDDCLPHPTFFRYCEELLERYKDDERVMMISGDNFQSNRKLSDYSYYFSRYAHIWGWATWRRAWEKYDVKMELWPTFRESGLLEHILGNKHATNYWVDILNKMYQGEIDSWDYALTFACWIQNSLTILPTRNLVSNIGFGADATHTSGTSKYSNMETFEMGFPLKHPPIVMRNLNADRYTQQYHYENRLPARVYRLVLNRIFDYLGK